jgi:hypothetical protein
MGKSSSPRTVKVYVAPREGMELAQLRRARSEADMIRPEPAPAPVSLTPVSLEEVKKDDMTEMKRQAFTVQGMVTKDESLEEIEEEGESSGSGIGKGGNHNRSGKRGRSNGDHSENQRIHDRYAELLKSDPGNPLLLRNYGKFLHEVFFNLTKVKIKIIFQCN